MTKTALRIFLVPLLSFCISSSHASQITGEDGQYFFRYKANISATTTDTELESKSVTAFYTAGIGIEFSEILPLKPEWTDDNWRVVSGDLPSGITFDTQTRHFSGTPSSITSNKIVNLEGYDKAGNFVARATVTFDVVAIEGVPVATTLYAHTGKFKVDELPIPDGLPDGTTISSWTRFYDLPSGITLSSRYVQGTPPIAGTHKLLIQGKDYKGNVVATYFGKYVVEDGPTFPHISDLVYKLPQLEWGYALQMNFGAPNPFSVNYKIDPSRNVRYYVEKKNQEELFPGNVVSNDSPVSLNLNGWIDQPYDTATIRFRAVDVDGTVGYSNWFKFGSSDPQPSCDPFAPRLLPFVTGVNSSVQVPVPYGDQGTLTYRLTSGSLPEGLSIDSTTGIISGIPLISGDNRDFGVVIDVTNGENVVSTECKYTANVQAGGVSYVDLVNPQDRHLRLGDYYNGRFSVVGGIPDYSLSFTDPSEFPYLSILSDTANATTVDFGGTAVSAGAKSVGFNLDNGDGSTYKGYIGFTVHNPLFIDHVPDLKVKRMGEPQIWAQIPYDEDSVIPDVVNGGMPQFTYTGISDLPQGLTLDASGYLKGETNATAGIYGPFTSTITDASDSTAISNSFNVIVEDRSPIKLSVGGEGEFNVEWDTTQTRAPFIVEQPAGAIDLKQTWTLSSVDQLAVPSWLSVNSETGSLSVSANTPYSQIGEHGPFLVTVEDEDGSSASVEFSVTLRDWPQPFASSSTARGNVSGDGPDETATYIPMPDLKTLVKEDTVIGGLDQLTFVSSNPASPAGLTFDSVNGRFVGQATEPYEGDVKVTFKDARDREGVITIEFEVKPYPAISAASNYQLPRNAFAENLNTPLAANIVEGFWNAPIWSIDTINGGDISSYGLSVNATTGVITGKTNAAEGTVISNVVLLATSKGANGETLLSRTAPFSITVAAPIPLEIVYNPDVTKFFLDEGTLVYRGKSAATAQIRGSFNAPLTWSLDSSSVLALSTAGLSINSTTGEIVGVPTRLGKWNVTVTATDVEGHVNVGGTALKVMSTLSGDILHDNSANVYRKLRVNEMFSTSPITVTNDMPPVVFSVDPEILDSGLNFDPVIGAFTIGSKISTAKNYNVNILAQDADDRTFGNTPGVFVLDVIPPLEVSVPGEATVISARQYSAEPRDIINVNFSPTVSNEIGDVKYSLDFDNSAPGTLIYKDGNVYMRVSDGAIISASSLPLDALVFDVGTASLKGVPSRSGVYRFRVVAHDNHSDQYEQTNDPSRFVNNIAFSQDIVLTVASATSMELVSSENPKGVIVPNGNGNMNVTPVYNAYGVAPAYSVSGVSNLPPGISYTVDTDGVHFSGTFSGTTQQLGNYSGITVTAVDTLGNTASLPVSFQVLLSTDPIGLTVSNIKTKIGKSIAMQPTADNYFGALRFYSDDLTGALSNQLALDQSSGLLSGTFNSVADHTIDIYVTDATNRVTSKPVRIEVIPNLNVVVPNQVTAMQGEALRRTIITDYAIGSVTYAKSNSSIWPEGFDVNPTTGEITNSNVTAAAGTYPDLQITAIDTFISAGQTQTDQQVSNRFSIVVSPISADPVIADRSKTILGTVGTAITAVTPTVTDDVQHKAWNYAGTVYTASHDLSQYGLTFDAATGRISGTPTEAFIIRDFTITVTAQNGASDTTAPFWIGVAPQEPMTVAANQTKYYVIRGDKPWSSEPIRVENTLGTVTFSNGGVWMPSQWSFNSVNGVWSAGPTPESEAFLYSNPTPDGHPTTTYFTDEFGRSGSFLQYHKLVRGLSVTANQTTSLPIGQYVSGINVPVVASQAGTVSFSATGLPNGIIVNASTGALEGTLSTNIYPNQTWSVTLTVRDTYNGGEDTASTVYSITAENPNPVVWSQSYTSTGAVSYPELQSGDIIMYAGVGNTSGSLSGLTSTFTSEDVNVDHIAWSYYGYKVVGLTQPSGDIITVPSSGIAQIVVLRGIARVEKIMGAGNINDGITVPALALPNGTKTAMLIQHDVSSTSLPAASVFKKQAFGAYGYYAADISVSPVPQYNGQSFYAAFTPETPYNHRGTISLFALVAK